MTAPIEDVSSLPGKKVSDQQGASIGKVKEIYEAEGGHPMWVEIEGSFGTREKRTVLIPLARLKDEDGDIGVPYSKDRIGDCPEVDTSDGISAESDRELRGYYGIGTGDQELRADNKSYATLVTDEPGAASRVEDVDQLETPDPDKRTDESMARLHDSQRREARSGGIDGVTDEESDDDGSAERDDDEAESDQ
ncbi:MAG: PRC-barrel domain-containing protein [Solirubrobacteraceae bacterium]